MAVEWGLARGRLNDVGSLDETLIPRDKECVSLTLLRLHQHRRRRRGLWRRLRGDCGVKCYNVCLVTLRWKCRLITHCVNYVSHVWHNDPSHLVAYASRNDSSLCIVYHMDLKWLVNTFKT